MVDICLECGAKKALGYSTCIECGSLFEEQDKIYVTDEQRKIAVKKAIKERKTRLKKESRKPEEKRIRKEGARRRKAWEKEEMKPVREGIRLLYFLFSILPIIVVLILVLIYFLR